MGKVIDIKEQLKNKSKDEVDKFFSKYKERLKETHGMTEEELEEYRKKLIEEKDDI